MRLLGCLVPVLFLAFVSISVAWKLEDDVESVIRGPSPKGEKLPIHIIIDIALRKLTRWIIPTASVESKSVSKKCRDDSKYYANALRDLEPWALKMYDATGKSQDGFLKGNLHAMGHFDQCVDIAIERFSAQYCNVHLIPVHVPEKNTSLMQDIHRGKRSVFDLFHIWSTFGSSEAVEPIIFGNEHISLMTKALPSWAFCLPATCSPEDVAIAVADAVGSFSVHNMQLAVQNGNNSCFVREKTRNYDTAAIVMITIFGIAGLLLLTGTLLETWLKLTNPDNKGTGNQPAYLQLLLCFSIFTNGRQVLRTEDEGTPHILRCLHGIKVLSFVWVVVGNTFSIYRFIPNSNAVYYEMSTQESALDQIIMNAYVSLDGFMFISGLLVTYITLRDLDNSKGRFNVFIYYIHRYLRFTPTYAIAIGFIASLVIYVDAGPNWAQVHYEAESCKKYWWQHLLYINNFISDDACYRISWYFANEAQFFLVSPIFIYALWKSRRIGLILLTVTTICFLAATIAIVAVYDITVQIATRLDIENHNFANVYNNKPWCRISPYLLAVAIGWCANTALSLSILLGLYGYVHIFSEEPKEAANAIYLGLHSCGWAISLGFVIVACVHGYGGFVDRILSWGGFVPLSKITFCSFLVHFEWINIYYARIRKPVFYSIGYTLLDGLGHVMASMAIGFALTVCIEAPLVNIQRMFVAGNFRDSYRFGIATEEIVTLDHQPVSSVTSNTTNYHIRASVAFEAFKATNLTTEFLVLLLATKGDEPNFLDSVEIKYTAIMKAAWIVCTPLFLVVCASFIQGQVLPDMDELDSIADLEDIEHLLMAKQWISNLTQSGGMLVEDEGRPIPIKLLLSRLARWLIPTSGNKPNVSQECSKDSNKYAKGLASLQGWAWKMYDASGKTPDGIWSGNVHAMGHYDQCLKIVTDNFKGKYCTASLLAKKAELVVSEDTPMPRSMFTLLRLLTSYGAEVNAGWNTNLMGATGLLPAMAFCLPDSCSNADLAAALADVIGSHALGPIQLEPYVPEENCFTAADSNEYEAGDIAMITILSIIAACLVAGTAYDGWKQFTNKPDSRCERSGEKPCFAIRFLMCFSILSNGSRILQSSGEGQLRCLNGIRLISMLWVFLGHLYMLTSNFPNANTRDFAKDTTSWTAQVIANGSVAVDTFFFLSGLLLAYIFLRELDRSKGRFNVVMFYVHRYFRLTPVYAFILAFLATLYKYVGRGPNWGLIVAESRDCQENWYKHLLYYNNMGSASACMGQTWYMANDMQMFLITPLIIWPLWRWRRAGLAWLGLVTAGFLVATLTIVGVNELAPTMMNMRYDVNNGDFFTLYYEKPWCRIAPYLVGIFIGWALHNTRGKRPKINTMTVIAGWTISITLALMIVYGMHDYQLRSRTPHIDLIIKVAYAGLHRFAWALILGWVVFACVHGYGGFADRLLSWEGFVPLSRLTYTTYLLHMHWISVYNARARVSFYYTPIDMALTYISHVTISTGFAFIVSTCIELPFLNLEKMIFAFADPRRAVPSPASKSAVTNEKKPHTEATAIEMDKVIPAQVPTSNGHENQAFEADIHHQKNNEDSTVVLPITKEIRSDVSS